MFQGILQQQQDTSIKRLSELREQVKLDRQAKEQLESLHQKEIRRKENRIEELTLQVNAQKDLIQLPTQADHEEIQTLRDKVQHFVPSLIDILIFSRDNFRILNSKHC